MNISKDIIRDLLTLLYIPLVILIFVLVIMMFNRMPLIIREVFMK